MSTFVLVHGGWHGGWCWQRVAPLLRDAGHRVHTPTLTGLGERAHLFWPGLNLDTHIEDVAAVLRFEDVEDAVLVGHSYGGMVISGVAELHAQRLRHMVFLDAAVPEDGQCYLDTLPLEFLEFTGALWSVDDGLVAPPPSQFLGLAEAEDVMWAEARFTPQPAAPAGDPVHLSSREAAGIPRTYLFTTGAEYSIYVEAYRKARALGWSTAKLECGHESMLTAPELVAEHLLDVVR